LNVAMGNMLDGKARLRWGSFWKQACKISP
jgi:hypothetical protein